MTKLIATALVFASDEELTLYEDYSGRGMFGQTTYGVVGATEEAYHDALAGVVSQAFDGLSNDEGKEEILKLIKNVRKDNLGRDMIFY